MTTTYLGDTRRGYLAESWRRRDFVWYTALANIRARNASSALGMFWWILNPLILAAVYFVVFGVILGTRRGDPNYIAYLLSGLFVFFYTRAVITSGSMAMRTNSRLIATRRFPRVLLPLISIVEAGLEFLGTIIPFYLIAGPVGGDWPGLFTFYLIPAFVIQTMFNVGLSLVFAQLMIPFPDIRNVTSYMARIWLYTSPVIFPIEERLRDLSEFWYTVFSVNPMVSILSIYRGALLGRPIPTEHWFIASAWGVGLLIIGIVTFRRNEDRLVRYL